jgi:hypothetical protein
VSGAVGDTNSIHLQGVSLPPDKVLYEGDDNRYWLHKLYYSADVLISMPVLKNHQYTGTTGSIKNVGIGATPSTIYGYYPGFPSNMRWYIDHNNPPRTNLHYFIHDYFLCRAVDFVVVDGLQGIQNGPVSRQTTPQLSDDQMNMRLILASKDPVAVDAINSLLTGHDPELIPHITTLHNDSMGYCDARLIRINGNKVGDEKKDFEIWDTGGLSKYDDFEPPEFFINECILTNNMLHFLLTADDEVTKIEVAIDGVYLNQIVIDSFEDFYIELDTIQIDPGTEVMVYAYDKYLNYSSQIAYPLTGISENLLSVEDISISCFPNPFSSSTEITFELLENTELNLSVHDMQGKVVKVLEDGILQEGSYKIKWDGTDNNNLEVSNGLYHCIIKSGKLVQTKKIIKF